MRRRWTTIVCVVLVLAAAIACTPRDVAEDECLGGTRPIVTAPATNTTRWPGSLLSLPNGTSIDARSSTFENSTLDENGFAVAVKFHWKETSRDDLCMVGGRVFTSFDPEGTSWSTWHRIHGMVVEVPDFRVVGTRFANEGDMILFSAPATNWRIIGVEAAGGPNDAGAYIHDDCIENDHMHAGLVDDTKLDGCGVFISAHAGGPSTRDGSANTVEVRNSLVRLQPFWNSYDTAKYGFNQHGGFFKWSAGPHDGGIPPQLYVHDSVFRADQQGVYGGNPGGFLGLPPGSTCHDVTLVGTEKWKLSDVASWTSQCTNLTLGTMADWDAAVAQWDADHPDM